MKEPEAYRLCVGMMVLNDKHQVWVGKRLDNLADVWQMPQGGVDDGEDYRAAALRELKEEIGTNDVTIHAESSTWLSYDLPDELMGKIWNGKYRGQKQKWFLMRLEADEAFIDIATKDPEFSEYKWVAPETLPDFIVPFKRQVYKNIVEEFLPIIKTLS